jgi:hypothetical protein
MVAVLTQLGGDGGGAPMTPPLLPPPHADSAISKNPGNVHWKAQRLVVFIC